MPGYWFAEKNWECILEKYSPEKRKWLETIKNTIVICFWFILAFLGWGSAICTLIMCLLGKKAV